MGEKNRLTPEEAKMLHENGYDAQGTHESGLPIRVWLVIGGLIVMVVALWSDRDDPSYPPPDPEPQGCFYQGVEEC